MENNYPEKKTDKTAAIILAVLGVLYGVSPIDVLPDVVPFAGQLDDLVTMGGALLNLAEAYTRDTSRVFSGILKFLKWGLVILGGILIVLIALFGIAIYKIVS